MVDHTEDGSTGAYFTDADAPQRRKHGHRQQPDRKVSTWRFWGRPEPRGHARARRLGLLLLLFTYALRLTGPRLWWADLLFTLAVPALVIIVGGPLVKLYMRHERARRRRSPRPLADWVVRGPSLPQQGDALVGDWYSDNRAQLLRLAHHHQAANAQVRPGIDQTIAVGQSETLQG